MVLPHNVKELWGRLPYSIVQFHLNLPNGDGSFEPVFSCCPFTSFTINFENINGSTLMTQFFHNCGNRFDIFSTIVTNKVSMIFHMSLSCSPHIRTLIKGVNFTMRPNVFMHTLFKGKIIIRSNTVYQTFLLRGNTMRITNPLASITAFSNPTLVLTGKLGFKVVLIKMAHWAIAFIGLFIFLPLIEHSALFAGGFIPYW
mmetsp:Transcript_21489/g.31799  ORF Transcript_21489/g.31799 Transcript_21489/m.31799 type:complete len:200 (-) Transcript_21489:371-970(-)